METAMEDGDCLSQDEESAWKEELDVAQLCRVCANPNDYLIPIFQGEGLEHELELKIAKHLPIKVSVKDKLPTNLCYQCASTLIAWHDMVIGCVEADEKLKALTQDKNEEYSLIEDMNQSNEEDFQADAKRDSICGNDQFKLINNAVTITEEEDINRINSLETEQIAIEEQITSLDPEFVEEVASDIRSISFRNYQIAIWALRDKLLNSKIKQHMRTRSVFKTTGKKTPVKETCFSKKIYRKKGGKGQIKSAGRDEIYMKSKHECSICGRVFTRSYDLKRHGLVHLNGDIFDSGRTNSLDCNIEESLNLLSKTITTFTCEVCSRVFKVKDSYERHKRIHTNERPFQCSECRKCFRDSGALTRHTKEVHAKIRSHPCHVCKKWFVNRATLEDHSRTHTGERPFVCHQCGLTFKSRAALYQHGKTHSNYLPHVCVYCAKCFRRRQELVSHLPVHTNVKTHICEKCGKAFSTRSELQRHINVHSDVKPFTCLTCGLNFSQKRYLKNHMKSRHGRSEDLQPTRMLMIENL